MGEIDGTIKALLEKHSVSESALRNLQKDLARIEHDLAVKTNSLDLDNACMDTRVKLVCCAQDDGVGSEVDGLREGIDNLQARDCTVEKEIQTPAATGKIDASSLHVTFQEESMKTDLKTTYDADFEEFKSKRSADLQRTLGKGEKVAMFA